MPPPTCIIEVPRPWLRNPYDGPVHREVFSSLMLALSEMRVAPRLISLPYGADDAPRSVPPGGLYISFHSRGEASPGLLRLKESSVRGYYMVDTHGYSGWSSLNRAPAPHLSAMALLDADESTRWVAGLHDRLRTANISKYEQREAVAPMDAPYVFMPLQIPSDRVVALFRIPYMDALDAAIDAAHAGMRLVIKRHPLCTSPRVAARLAALKGHPFVALTDGSIHGILPGASAVLLGNSGVGIEAIMAQRPVASFADAEYTHVTHALHGVADIRAVFHAPVPHDRSVGARFIHHLLNTCSVELADDAALQRHLKAALVASGEAAAARSRDYDLAAQRRVLSGHARGERARRKRADAA
jgi:hypothetical protein